MQIPRSLLEVLMVGAGTAALTAVACATATAYGDQPAEASTTTSAPHAANGDAGCCPLPAEAAPQPSATIDEAPEAPTRPVVEDEPQPAAPIAPAEHDFCPACGMG